jgi:hypothetical protein
MVYAYLSRLSEVAQGSLPTLERARLVEQIRRCIDAQREPSARDDAGRVERILDRMGEPDVIVDEALRRLTPEKVSGPPGEPPPGVVPVEPAGGPKAVSAGGDPPGDSRSAVGRAPLVDTADLPFRVSEPAAADPAHLVVSTNPLAEAEPDVLNRLSDRRRELFALLALSVGTVLLSYAGLVVGCVLVGTSKLWAGRDKLLTLFALPLLTLFGGIVLTWLQATRLDPAVETGDRLARAGEWLWATLLALPIVVGWIAALYLGYQLLRAMRD